MMELENTGPVGPAIIDDYPREDFDDFFEMEDVEIQMKKIMSGSYYKGKDDGHVNERPRHRVHMTRNFWMSLHPITEFQYQEVIKKNPSMFKDQEGSANYPVEKVSWDNAVTFCKKLTELEREAGRLPEPYVYRLPTEAEWEYVCRGGSDEDFVEDIETISWYFKNSNERAHVVGTKEPNNWGFYDMQGNVWEWVMDGCDFQELEYYENPAHQLQKVDIDDAVNPFNKDGANKIAKGGCWLLDPASCRPSARFINPPDSKYFVLGFRIVLGEPLSK
jgi:formylglycine-generating enzyme required for sulfatase activity